MKQNGARPRADERLLVFCCQESGRQFPQPTHHLSIWGAGFNLRLEIVDQRLGAKSILLAITGLSHRHGVESEIVGLSRIDRGTGVCSLQRTYKFSHSRLLALSK